MARLKYYIFLAGWLLAGLVPFVGFYCVAVVLSAL